MGDLKGEYKKKLVKAERAVEAVCSGDWVDYTMAHGIPIALDQALAARRQELKDVKVRACLSLREPEIIKADPKGETFTYCNWHFGGLDRKLYNEGKCFYIPLLYKNMPSYYRSDLDVDVAMVCVTPMDRHGYFGFSLNNSATAAILERAKTVIVEVNENLPPVYGMEDCIHISRVNYIVEGENQPLATLPRASEISKIDEWIAGYVIEEIEDGSVLQMGIGSLPDTVGRMIAGTDLKNLGMHTEMLVDAYYDLYKAGKLTNCQKQIDRNKGVWTFCMGTKELYQWVDENRGLMSAPVSYCNSPEVMAQNDKLVGINSCIEMDLFGQVCSESSGYRQITGTGGQLDFITGCRMSKGGKGFICMSSVFKDKEGNMKSRIVPTMQPGSIVTTPRSSAFYAVTEYGKLNMAGLSTWQRAEGMIGLAHPDFRESLIKQAEKMKIWRRSNRRDG